MSVCVQLSFLVFQLNRAKAEARLALLSESTPGTEQWLHAAMNQVEEELERERHLSEQRKSTEDFSVCKQTNTQIELRFHHMVACMSSLEASITRNAILLLSSGVKNDPTSFECFFKVHGINCQSVVLHLKFYLCVYDFLAIPFSLPKSLCL